MDAAGGDRTAHRLKAVPLKPDWRSCLGRKCLDEFWVVLAASALAVMMGLGATAICARVQDPAKPTQGGTPAPSPSGTPAPSQEPAGAPPPPAEPAPGAKKSGKDKNKDTATQNAPDQPVWDPLRAEKDLQVGHYYMNKGDVDAAIDRFEDAIVAKPGYAIPFLYLGEAQEKKGQKRLAAKSYTKYLDLDPHASDAAKIRKKIDKLYKELEAANK
jgi:tetratricopeptide (TPR) repeat protein